MKAKTILVITPEEVGILVANGTAEIGVQQFQLLMSIADIELVGPLSVELQETLVFSAAIMADTKNAEAAKALVNFLRTPEAAAVIKANGLAPGTDSTTIAVRTENEATSNFGTQCSISSLRLGRPRLFPLAIKRDC